MMKDGKAESAFDHRYSILERLTLKILQKILKMFQGWQFLPQSFICMPQQEATSPEIIHSSNKTNNAGSSRLILFFNSINH